eukprot:7381373-Prymnesium_polylepis.1
MSRAVQHRESQRVHPSEWDALFVHRKAEPAHPYCLFPAQLSLDQRAHLRVVQQARYHIFVEHDEFFPASVRLQHSSEGHLDDKQGECGLPPQDARDQSHIAPHALQPVGVALLTRFDSRLPLLRYRGRFLLRRWGRAAFAGALCEQTLIVQRQLSYVLLVDEVSVVRIVAQRLEVVLWLGIVCARART